MRDLAAYRKEAETCTRAETFREKVTRYWEYHSPPSLKGVLWNFTLGQSPARIFRFDEAATAMAGAMTMFPFSPEDVQEHFISAEQLMRACDQVWSADSRADISHRARPASCRIMRLLQGRSSYRTVRSSQAGPQSCGSCQLGERPADHQGIFSKMPAADCALVQHKHSNEGREIERLAARSGEFVLRHHSQGATHRRAFAPIRPTFALALCQLSNGEQSGCTRAGDAPFPGLEKCGLGNRPGSRARL